MNTLTTNRPLRKWILMKMPGKNKKKSLKVQWNLI